VQICGTDGFITTAIIETFTSNLLSFVKNAATGQQRNIFLQHDNLKTVEMMSKKPGKLLMKLFLQKQKKQNRCRNLQY